VGSGVMTLSGVSTYSGDTIVSGGTLKAGIANAIPSGSALLLQTPTDPVTFDLGGYNVGLFDLQGTATSFIDNNAVGQAELTLGSSNTDITFAGVVKNTGGALLLKKVGTANLTLTGANTYTGATTVSDGDLVVGDGGSNGSLVSSVFLDAGAGSPNLVFHRAGTVSYPGAVSGVGGVYVRGGGTVTFSGTVPSTVAKPSGLSHGWMIEDGALAVAGQNGLLPATGKVLLGSSGKAGKLVIGGAGGARTQTIAGLGVSAAGGASGSVVGGNLSDSTLTVNASVADTGMVYSGVFGGVGANENALRVVKDGGGELVLTGSSTATGLMTVSGSSVLSIGNNGTVGWVVAPIEVGAGSTLQFRRTDAVTYGGGLSGVGGIQFKSGGEYKLTAQSTNAGAV